MTEKHHKVQKNSQNKQHVVRTKLQIVHKQKINHDCYIFDLKWFGPKFTFHIGQHLRVIEYIPTWQHEQGQQIIRKYTPISPCNKQQQGIKLLIKIYRPNSNPNFLQGGKLTPYLQKLGVGDKINVEGPYGKFEYKQKGIVILDGIEHKIQRIYFIAGGTGITPCYQTITEIIGMKQQTIELVLLFCNKSQEDIVLRKQLETLQPRLKLMYLVDKQTPDWKHLTGHVTKQIMESICPLDDPATLYAHCGPPPMNAKIRQIFSKYYPSSIIFKY